MDKELAIGKREWIIGLIAVFIIFGFVLFRLQGVLVMISLFILYILPTYLIMRNFGLKKDEVIVFSIFLSLSIVPTLVYWLGFLISFRIAIFVSFIILLLIGYFIGRSKKKVEKKEAAVEKTGE